MEGEVKGKTYKMKGHTLPGINQRLDATATNVAAEGLAGSSVFQQGMMGAAQALHQRRNPITPGGGGGGGGGGLPGGIGASMANFGKIPPIMSKPSVAKHTAIQGSSKKAYSGNRNEVNKHNASSATASHFGDPHGPKPSAAKRYKKKEGESTMGSYPSMRKIKK